MTTYTVEIQIPAGDTHWHVLVEDVEYDGTADDLATWVAGNQSVTDEPGWRVQVWTGADATDQEPCPPDAERSSVRPPMQRHELDAWLGPAADELTPEQIERVAEASRDLDARYPGPDDQDKREAALSATVQYLLGETGAAEVARELTAARSRMRLAYVAAVQVAVMMVRDGQQKKGSAKACAIDRMALLKALGER